MPRQPLDTKSVTTFRGVRIPERIDDELRRRAELEDRTVSDVLREAISRYLEEVNTAA